MTTDPPNLLPGLHEAMRLLKQNDLDYGPGRIIERVKELGGSVDEQKAEPRDFWLVGGRSFLDKFIAEHSNHNNDPIIHCREVVE